MPKQCFYALIAVCLVLAFQNMSLRHQLNRYEAIPHVSTSTPAPMPTKVPFKVLTIRSSLVVDNVYESVARTGKNDIKLNHSYSYSSGSTWPMMPLPNAFKECISFSQLWSLPTVHEYRECIAVTWSNSVSEHK